MNNSSKYSDEQEQLVRKKQWLDDFVQHARSVQLMRALRMGCSCIVSTLPQAADMPSFHLTHTRRQAFQFLHAAAVNFFHLIKIMLNEVRPEAPDKPQVVDKLLQMLVSSQYT